jgi:hypothetical protein
MRRYVEQVYLNITLMTMLANRMTQSATIVAYDGRSVWHYQQKSLLVVYPPALGAILLFAIYGLWCTFTSLSTMRQNLSSILISTRSPEISVIAEMDPSKCRKQKLHFNDRTARFCLPKELPDTSPSVTEDLKSRSRGYPPSSSPTSPSLGSYSGWPVLSIALSSILLAAAISIGHYIYISRLDGRSVASHSQFWTINISNAFAQALVLVLRLGATIVLVQAVSTHSMSPPMVSNVLMFPIDVDRGRDEIVSDTIP